MKIKLTRKAEASDKEIEALEKHLNFSLDHEFRSFLKENNGAKPETNIFKIDDGNDSGVNEFIPVAKIFRELGNLENLSTESYPIAWAEGGNYVVLNGEKVLFWDHENPKEMILLANSLKDFLGSLEPFDPSGVELKPGQVKEAWIDPEFLKQFQ